MRSSMTLMRKAVAGGAVALVWLAAAAAAVSAQGGRVVERVAATVDKEVVLQSEVDEQLAFLAASQQFDPSDTAQVAAARASVLNELIDQKLILAYAGEKGIVVTDDQINPQVEQALEEARSRVGSEAEFTQELQRQGLTLAGLRERYLNEIRNQAMIQRIVDREIRSKVKIGDADVDTFYTNNKSQLPTRPTVYDLSHILVVPKPDQSRRAVAKQKAQRALQRLETGEEWEAVCRSSSEDPSTAASGGDLGDARLGDFDPQFEAAVRQLEPGQRSDIVESSFGYHIIQLLARQGDAYRARHILILSQPTPEDVARAIERAARAREMARKGDDWTVLVNSYSDDAGSRGQAGRLGQIPASQLSPQYQEALDSLKVDGISEVLQGPTGYHIFKLHGRTEGGEYKLEDIREQLKEMLTRKKLSEEYDRWIADLRKKAFIEIKKG